MRYAIQLGCVTPCVQSDSGASFCFQAETRHLIRAPNRVQLSKMKVEFYGFVTVL
jgi:hypothetical protein